MRNPDRVRAIFQELRAAGIDASARDLLRLAHFILRANLTDQGENGDFSPSEDSRALPLLPVDVAMNTGGWRVMEFENIRLAADDPSPTRRGAIMKKLNKLLGPQWECKMPPG